MGWKDRKSRRGENKFKARSSRPPRGEGGGRDRSYGSDRDDRNRNDRGGGYRRGRDRGYGSDRSGGYSDDSDGGDGYRRGRPRVVNEELSETRKYLKKIFKSVQKGEITDLELLDNVISEIDGMEKMLSFDKISSYILEKILPDLSFATFCKYYRKFLDLPNMGFARVAFHISGSFLLQNMVVQLPERLKEDPNRDNSIDINTTEPAEGESEILRLLYDTINVLSIRWYGLAENKYGSYMLRTLITTIPKVREQVRDEAYVGFLNDTIESMTKEIIRNLKYDQDGEEVPDYLNELISSTQLCAVFEAILSSTESAEIFDEVFALIFPPGSDMKVMKMLTRESSFLISSLLSNSKRLFGDRGDGENPYLKEILERLEGKFYALMKNRMGKFVLQDLIAAITVPETFEVILSSMRSHAGVETDEDLFSTILNKERRIDVAHRILEVAVGLRKKQQSVYLDHIIGSMVRALIGKRKNFFEEALKGKVSERIDRIKSSEKLFRSKMLQILVSHSISVGAMVKHLAALDSDDVIALCKDGEFSRTMESLAQNERTIEALYNSLKGSLVEVGCDKTGGFVIEKMFRMGSRECRRAIAEELAKGINFLRDTASGRILIRVLDLQTFVSSRGRAVWEREEERRFRTLDEFSGMADLGIRAVDLKMGEIQDVADFSSLDSIVEGEKGDGDGEKEGGDGDGEEEGGDGDGEKEGGDGDGEKGKKRKRRRRKRSKKKRRKSAQE